MTKTEELISLLRGNEVVKFILPNIGEVEKSTQYFEEVVESLELVKLLTPEKLKKQLTCGCGLCLAHNNMQCPVLNRADT